MLQANDDDGDFFKEFETAKKEVFEWIRDEYRLRRTPSRLQRRDIDAVNGDTWYRNYQIKECQGSNKSSFCNGQQHVGHEANRAPEISELFDELDGKEKSTQSDGGKLQAQTHRSGGADGKNIQHLLPVGDHRELAAASNYGPIEARLSAKQFLAKEQNAVHEIEMKHRHLPADNDGEASEKMLNGNQLPGTSLNSNFPLTFNLDTSKRSTSQQQKLATAARTPVQHFDDQLNQKKNDLFDEVDEKLSKKEQQGLVFQPLRRVKRRDVNEINRSMTNEKNDFDESLESSEIGDGKSN